MFVLSGSFAGHCEATSGSVERIVLRRWMAKDLLPHALPRFVQYDDGRLHGMERIGDLPGVGKHRVELGPLRA